MMMEIERVKSRRIIITDSHTGESLLSLEDELFEQRVARVREIEALGYRPFGKRFDFTCTIPEVLRQYGEKTAEELVPEIRVKIAGRIQTIRRMGKAGFMHIQQNG